MRKEIWKTIRGFKDYQVSNRGRVRKKSFMSVSMIGTPRRVRPRILKMRFDGTVRLYKSGGSFEGKSTARLVYNAFVKKLNRATLVSHKNGDKLDNRVSNLYVLKAGRSKIPVIQLDRNTLKVIARYDSIKEASEKTGIHYTGISMTCNGHIEHAGGYYWEKED